MPRAKSAKPAPTNAPKGIETLLDEKRQFKPISSFAKHAHWNSPSIYKKAADNPEKFWAEMAENLVWKKKWTKVLEWKAPDAKWFVGGKLNITETCLDQHLSNGRKTKRR